MILRIYLAIINLITFLLFLIDKFKATKQTRRIPEKILLIFTAFGGFIGGILGMIAFHHKTIKSSFQIKFWGIVFVWIFKYPTFTKKHIKLIISNY